MSQITPRFALLPVLLLAVPVAVGCGSAGPETAADEQNLLERNCPIKALDALLECDEPGGGELRFVSHVGTYVLVERSVEEDMVGAKELSCRYGEDPTTSWASVYTLGDEILEVGSVDELEALLEIIPDLNDEERALVRDSIEAPTALIRYEYGFWGRGDVTCEGLSTGLEQFRPSASEDNPAAAKTNFIIDETAYWAGFGGTYATGLSCRLTLEAR
jgi:hypothetical protein